MCVLDLNAYLCAQDFGAAFEADGRLQGNLSVQTVQCTDNICDVQVPAPGFALVFLTDTAFSEVNPASSAVATFSTTTSKKSDVTATVNPSVLATSNGHGGPGEPILLGSTSDESGAGRAVALPWMSVLVAVALGAAVVGQRTLV